MCVCVCDACILSHVQLFVTPWSLASSSPRDSPDKNDEMGCHTLLQGYLGVCVHVCVYIHTHTHTHILIHIHVSKLKLDVKICTLDYTFYFHKKLVKVNFKTCGSGTSLVAQWVRIRCQCRGHGFYPWPRKIPHDVEQLSLWATTTEPMVHNKRSHWEACALQVGSSPCSLQLEKTHV